ncbi:Uncharacterized conserved protein, UPF0276 family [Gracilibacillus ureilyticus]|uniref:Uncharacterized conserved protein, UPF0276 family n=2 Tax=Gracilibacillus ureilyticus TaxID=531814 RepID=A0A1H9TWQ1_9BACI|nr:Uncharacterized conserved protein, UPF0276 family [Gracilibacillus ureilyticus]
MIEIDMFKCPDFSKELIYRAEQLRPCYVHFGLNAGNCKLNKVDWEKIEALRKYTATPFVNVHAVAYVKDYPEVDIFTTNPSEINQIVQATLDDLGVVIDRFGAENIIIENVICRGINENMLKPIIDPEILSKIVKETGCGLLLDTAHAQMTSKCLGLNVREYISSLPLDRLKELHITGVQPDQKGRLRDSMPMSEEDWELAKWVIQQIKTGYCQEPWITSLEYGGVGPKFEWRTDEEVLAKQVPVLFDLIK